MFTKCLAGLQPAGHFHFQQLFGCDPYTALAQSVHHDAPVSVQSGAADIDVRCGGTAMPHERLGHGQPAGGECYGCGLVAQGVEAEGLDPCELSRNLRISVTKLENGARHFSAVGTVIA